MIFWNAKDPELAPLAMVPWFIGTDPIDMAVELAGRLEKYPDRTFCLIAHENNVVQAMLIAYRVNRKVVWLWQSHQRQGFKYTKFMFEALKQWSRTLKCKQIRMKTPDRKRAFARRWGFEPHRDYMRLRL